MTIIFPVFKKRPDALNVLPLSTKFCIILSSVSSWATFDAVVIDSSKHSLVYPSAARSIFNLSYVFTKFSNFSSGFVCPSSEQNLLFVRHLRLKGTKPTFSHDFCILSIVKVPSKALFSMGSSGCLLIILGRSSLLKLTTVGTTIFCSGCSFFYFSSIVSS